MRLGTRGVVNAVTVAAVALFWLVSTSWHPWDLFDRGGFSADFYDEQARALLHGHLAVDPAVSSIEGFVIDGRSYLYYGPFLAIARLPFQLLGDVSTGRLVRASMLLAVVVLCRWTARIAQAGRRAVAPGAASAPDVRTERWTVGIFTAAVAFSPAFTAAGWITVYNETELWAFALAVVGVTLLLEWAATGFSATRPLVGAIFAAGGATLTRAPIGMGVALAIGACGLVLAWRRGPQRGRTAWLAMAGGLAPVAAHAAVNVAKFGTLLSVPGTRQQLSLDDPSRAAWFAGNGDSFFSTRFLSTTVVHYLRPDAIRFERLVPGIRFGPLAEERGTYPLLSNTPASSLTVTATLLLLLAVVGAVWVVRQRARTWGLVALCTGVGALPTLLIGFIANRYLIDLLPPLVVLGATGVWAVSLRSWSGAARRAIRIGGVLLVVWGIWVNASLATWSLDQRSPGFTDLRYRVDGWLFPDPSPGLVRVAPGDPAAREGLTGIEVDPDLGCTGVYTAEQGRWQPIERGAARDLSTTVTPDGDRTVLAHGTTWRLDLVLSDGDAARIVVTDRDGREVSDQLLPRWERLAPGGSVPARVIVDPVVGEFAVIVGRGSLYLPGSVVSTSPIETSGPAVTSALCERLRDRL
ncbi:MAG: hypothetical protein ACJ739_12760 [Acidimicrobiales bacterium]